MKAGFKYFEIKDMDLWQYYAHLMAFQEMAKEETITSMYQKRQAHMLFLLCKAKGMESEFNEFFDFEDKINALFEDKKVKENTKEIAGKGKFEQVNGQEEWVYEYSEVRDIMSYINQFNH